MGQYRQWLHYREVDQLLGAQLETFEKELAQLQDQLHLLDDPPIANNALIQALTRQCTDSLTPSFSTAPHSEPTLLPEDMATVSDESAQTQPPLMLPWWFHHAPASGGQDNDQLDQQSLRTDISVQRWNRNPSELEREDRADEQHKQSE